MFSHSNIKTVNLNFLAKLIFLTKISFSGNLSNDKGKRRNTNCMYSRSFRKHEAISLSTHGEPVRNVILQA